MIKNLLIIISFLVIFILNACILHAQNIREPQGPAEWSQLYQPFQIAGNLYYVGTYDLACYLITTNKGHILINTGLASSASTIKSNIELLGFKFADIKILLTTQAHYDHMGAMAEIKKLTGAKMIVDSQDSSVTSDGGKSDYALGSYGVTYEPVKVDRTVKDGDVIKLGNMQITMLHHPGHTKGSCSYLFDVKDKAKYYKILIANMPTIVTSEKFSDISSYPEIAQDYEYTLNAMKKLSFDIWLSSHASQFGLHNKHKPLDKYNPNLFVDREGYDTIIDDLQNQFSKKLQAK